METPSLSRYQTYYAKHKQRIVDRVVKQRRQRKQSKEHIEATRQQLLDDINTGKRHYIHQATAKRYGLTRCPKTRKWLYQPPEADIDIEESSDDRTTYPDYTDLNKLMFEYNSEQQMDKEKRIHIQRVLLTYAQDNKNTTNRTKRSFIRRIMQTLGLSHLHRSQ